MALKYIHLAEPAIEDSTCSKGQEPFLYLYEREKLGLMKRHEDSTAYVNYLQNRSASYLNWYYSIIAKREEYNPN